MQFNHSVAETRLGQMQRLAIAFKVVKVHILKHCEDQGVQPVGPEMWMFGFRYFKAKRTRVFTLNYMTSVI